MRIRLMALPILVIVTAAGLVALRSPSELKACLTFTAAVFLLIAASIGTWLGRRAAWAGFAPFGWAALVLAFGISTDAPPVPRPLTTLLLEALFPYTGIKTLPLGGLGASGFQPPVGSPSLVLIRTGGGLVPVPLPYLQVGHSLFALIIAAFGAGIGVALAQALGRHQPSRGPDGA